MALHKEEDLPPTPFISAIRPVLNTPRASSDVRSALYTSEPRSALSVNLIPTSRSVSSISTDIPTSTVTPTVTVNDAAVTVNRDAGNDDVVRKEKLEKERKHQFIKNIVKRNREKNTDVYQSYGNEADALLEHIKQGGIMAKIDKKERETDTIVTEVTKQKLVNEDQEEDFNSPPGLSIFVQPISFFAEIEVPAITNSNDPFEADLLTAPPQVLRELVISNTILSMFTQKPAPATVVRWLMRILLMSDDKVLSQAALSVLTNLLHQTSMCSLPAESFHITYNDVMKIIVELGVNVNADGDIQSSLSSTSEFKLEYKEKELLIHNLNNFIKYLTTLLTMYPEVSPLLFPEKLIVLLLRISLDFHVIDSILNTAVVQCIGTVLSCYNEEEWNSTKIDHQLCQSFLAITDDYHNWYKIVTNIGNITTRSRHLQKQFARTVVKIKTAALVVPDSSSDLDFVVAFIQTLYNQKEEYNLYLLHCLLDFLFMLISLDELSKGKDSDRISNLIDYLSLLSNRIHDNPENPITGFVKSSILRLRNVLQCTYVSAQQLQRSIWSSNKKVILCKLEKPYYLLVRVG